MKRIVIAAMSIFSYLYSYGDNIITYENKDGYVLVKQTNGPDLGYSPKSGVKIIERDGFAFKSFDGSDELYPYEDWRLSARERAADLAARMSIDEIAGLMLYSPQNKLPMPNDTYNGLTFSDSGLEPWAISDGQYKFLLDDNVRHVLVSAVASPETAARWNNNIQALVEGRNHGIPANNSSDPRHSAFHDAEFSPGAAGQLSLWSNLLGLASTFSPETVRQFADIMRAEYKALGLSTALSPQADLGTDPRWYRYSSTFGNDPALVADLVREYTDGLQSSPESPVGDWGPGSVNAMAKHWPGGGSGEGGRDAHYGNGKYAVYPGGCYDLHKIPFTQGAFALRGATGKASAIMPYYTISHGITDEEVGNSYNHDIITRQLREECDYDGVVCTDWAITWDQIDPGVHSGKPWGVEHNTVAERHYKALKAGVDQFGGNNEKAPVIEAFHMGCEEIGEEAMLDRMRLSAQRLLTNMFRPGLFENPYVDVAEAIATVGNPKWMALGYEQQLRSVIMLKNHNNLLPLTPKTRIYVPARDLPAMRNYWGGTDAARSYNPVPAALGSKYFTMVDSADDADVAIVFMDSPKSHRMGYDPADVKAGGNGYIPISLQYRPYKAINARRQSIATDKAEPVYDRSYHGKTTFSQNECELDLLERTRSEMGDKPVIVVMMLSNPMVMAEVEPLADAILAGFSVQTQAFLDLISGKAEPSGLLPFEMPLSMDAIENHNEDQPHDIVPYTDADGNSYGFAYGLNFSGIISDNRTTRYGLKSGKAE